MEFLTRSSASYNEYCATVLVFDLSIIQSILSLQLMVQHSLHCKLEKTQTIALPSIIMATPMPAAPLQETAAIARLRADLQTADAVLEALAAETSLFQRAMYKNQSQHRRAFFFQHLQQVRPTPCIFDMRRRSHMSPTRSLAVCR